MGALIWLKMELGFQVKWSLSWLEASVVEWGCADLRAISGVFLGWKD